VSVCQLRLRFIDFERLPACSSLDNNHDQRVHFGLRQSDKIDIHWPRSLAQGLTVSSVDRILTVVEGKGMAP
jgi:hypothetical protein